ncbi:Sec-independent protein translocase subunit TatA [Gordonia sp. (in: high G+C Gram-positive bacteria)]|uniref:Sec-independent protein translocase subunit TatA n=1 Tax=Gordonia sp. (in: high G+C Gram-positive bacteria) TaxID=84139 RepID=UPI0039E59539
MPWGLTPGHLIIVLIAFLILFGAGKLPDAARGIGRSLRIFKSELGEMAGDGKDKEAAKAADDPQRELPPGDGDGDGAGPASEKKSA